MSKRSILVALTALAAIFGAASAHADNSLAVTPAAALGGTNYGLAVTTMGGSTNEVYVVDQNPNDELVYRFEFRANRNGIMMENGSAHAIFVARRGMPTVNNIRVFMQKVNDEFKIRIRAKKEGAGTANCGKTSFAPGGGVRIGMEWVAASTTGASDGICRLFRNGVQVFENTNVSNFGMEVDAVRFGLPFGDVESDTNGDFYLDEFSSFRTLAP